MSDFYQPEHRQLQDQFGSRALADTFEANIVTDSLPKEHADFIASRRFFFLSTVTRDGEPTVSFKGGDIGFVCVIDDHTIRFPSYDGNGMYLSAGNIAATAKIGLLFIDFETPHRVRVQATATILDSPTDLAAFPGAELVIEARIDETFVNCGRYIPKHTEGKASPHVPDAAGSQPIAAWKRMDALQDVLPEKDQGRAEADGGLIDLDEYVTRVQEGRP